MEKYDSFTGMKLIDRNCPRRSSENWPVTEKD